MIKPWIHYTHTNTQSYTHTHTNTHTQTHIFIFIYMHKNVYRQPLTAGEPSSLTLINMKLFHDVVLPTRYYFGKN